MRRGCGRIAAASPLFSLVLVDTLSRVAVRQVGVPVGLTLFQSGFKNWCRMMTFLRKLRSGR